MRKILKDPLSSFNNIYCYGCSHVLSSEDIKKGYDDKDENLLCYECKNFPDFENWPPIGY